jgi:DNA-binding phage protein
MGTIARQIARPERQPGRMARMTSRPRTANVWYRDVPYELDLVRCRRALVERQVDGTIDSMEGLARTVGISRSTASRFFSGRATSLVTALRIVDALGLTFGRVACLAEQPAAPDWQGAVPQPGRVHAAPPGQ